MEREQRIDVEVLAMLTRLGVMVMQAWYPGARSRGRSGGGVEGVGAVRCGVE